MHKPAEDSKFPSLVHHPANSQDSTQHGESLPSTVDAPVSDTTNAAVGGSAHKGRYSVLKAHAQGGLGRVSLAEDQKLQRQVALKEIRPDRANDPGLRRRFITEARITSMLEHPGIVPIYTLDDDADGQPYYAMRFIHGHTLSEAIRAHHAQPSQLSWRELLKRFVAVCQTMAYAHSKGVIHRDLKPANVMLGDYGETLVVDWGLAKVATNGDGTTNGADAVDANESEYATLAGQVLGTPAYMSPEQALGDAQRVGPTSDIYALGAMLYELLTGHVPYSGVGGAAAAIEQLRLRQPCHPPRHWKRDVPRPLEAICLKAMSPEISNRYETANQIADDVDRFLADEPVSCHREPLSVRTRRFIRRHQLSVASLAVAVLVGIISLSVGLVIVTGKNDELARNNLALDRSLSRLAQANSDLAQSNTAERQARIQEQTARKQSEAVRDYLVSLFRSPDPELDGREVKVVAVLDRAVRELQTMLADQPPAKIELLSAVAVSYISLGLPKEAVPLLEEARDLALAHYGSTHGETLRALHNLGSSLHASGRVDESLQLLEQAAKLAEAHFGVRHENTLKSQNELASAYLDAGRFHDAETLYESVYLARRTTLGERHPDTLNTLNGLTGVLFRAGRWAEARPNLEQILAVYEQDLGDDHPSTLTILQNLAVTYDSLGRSKDAIPMLERSIKAMQVRFGEDHPKTLETTNNLARIYLHVGRDEEALQLAEQATTRLKAVLGVDHGITCTAMNNLASIYLNVGRIDDAETILRELLSREQTSRGKQHPDNQTTMNNLATALLRQNKFDEGIALLQETLALMESSLGARHPDRLTVMDSLGGALAASGRLGEAARLYEQTLEFREALLGPDHRDTLLTVGNLALVYLLLDKPRQANPMMTRYIEGNRARLGDKTLEFANFLAESAIGCMQRRCFAQAESLLRESLAIFEELAPQRWGVAYVQCALGAALTGMKRFEEAEPLLLQGHERLLDRNYEIPALDRRRRLQESLEWLAQLYEARGNPEQAAVWLQKLEDHKNQVRM